MATVTFLYRSTRSKAPLTLRLYFDDAILAAKTKLIVGREYWEQHHLSNSRDVNIRNRQIEVNKELDSIEQHVLNKVDVYGLENVNSQTLKDIVLSYYEPLGKVTDNLLINAIEQTISNAPLKVNSRGSVGLSYNRIKALKQLKRVVVAYQGTGNPFKVKDVGLRFARDFKKHLIDTLKYSPVTAMKYVADVKTVCFDAEKNDIEVNPQLKHIQVRTVKNDYVIYLTLDELEQIKRTNMEQEYLKNAQKWLLLGCSIGQRVSDLLRITSNNFVSRNGLDLIELKQQKTGKQITIPVLTATKEVYDSGLPYPISTQKLNVYLKEVCKRSGIDKQTEGLVMDAKTKRKVKGIYPKWMLIASHVCRRSFATNLYGALPTPLIMSITGHSTEKMFLNYIGKSSMDYAQQIADFYTLQTQKQKGLPTLKIIKKSKAGNE